MGLTFTKLNNDSSWLWEFNGKRIVVDPWFTESQIDFAPWFSEQFHLDEQIDVSVIQEIDYIFISNPFTDHCNKETLEQFNSDIPVVATKKVLKKIISWGHFKQVIPLENFEMKIDVFQPTSRLDLVHNSYLFHTNNGKVMYAPHGTDWKNEKINCDVLITTPTTYKLPFWLGGTVNLGLEKAIELKILLQAKTVLCTHDEAKKGKGLVEKFAKKQYPQKLPQGFVSLQSGETYSLD